jgi:hypothetical protein
MLVSITEDERRVVIGAYRDAVRAGCGRAECYRAGVEALQELWPEVAKHHAASHAVAVIADHLGLDRMA